MRDELVHFTYVDGTFSGPEFVTLRPNFEPWWSLCISPDNDYLIFSGGDEPDLFVCFKNKLGQWGNPVHLKNGVNTAKWERFPSLSPDGNYLFFNRGDGDSNQLFWVSTAIIEEIKSQFTVTDIEGNVYNTVTIGSQVWLAENLRTTHYLNGDPIETTNPAIRDYNSESEAKYQWVYNDDESLVNAYGRLYATRLLLNYQFLTEQAVMNSGDKKVGWSLRCIKDAPANLKQTNKPSVPDDLMLNQNYPNPFNPETTIRYSLKQVSRVRLTVCDVLGRQIRILYEGMQPAGIYSFVWNSKDEDNCPASSGIYLYRLETENQSIQKKMLLIR